MSTPHPLVKVELRGEDDDEVETLWAFHLGGNRYKLDNTPWYAYGVSTGDTIEAEVEVPGEFPVFRRVVEKSGFRTLRITASDDFAQELFEAIKQLGCTYEGATLRYVAINIPPDVELEKVADFLTTRDIRWEYADPTYETVHGLEN